jgi:hypothetical protein
MVKLLKYLVCLSITNLLAFSSIAATSGITSDTKIGSNADIYVYANRYIPPDVNCPIDIGDNAQVLFSWQTFSALNVPIYYNQHIAMQGHEDSYWGRSPGWIMKAPNLAPKWSLLINPERIANGQLPSTVISGNWQCDQKCLESHNSRVSTDDNHEISVIDTNGNQIYSEIRVNEAWMQGAQGFKWDDSLSKQGLRDYFTLGRCPDGFGSYEQSQMSQTLLNLPSVMIKIGWKILANNEDKERYITMRLGEPGKEVFYGVVAMHIAVKTTKYWSWIWSTFEHENNFKGYRYKEQNIKPTFYEKTNHPEKKLGQALTPYTNIPGALQTINEQVKAIFSKSDSPLAYYKMLGTQYRDPLLKTTNEASKEDQKNCNSKRSESPVAYYQMTTDGKGIIRTNSEFDCKNFYKIVTPDLYNPVFEPDLPNNDLDTQPSCISCHLDATAEISNSEGDSATVYSDFSFVPKNHGFRFKRNHPKLKQGK